MMNIGIIGAGNVGGELGALLAEKGYNIRYGVRNPESEKTKAALARTPGAEAVDNQAAVDFADAIVLATDADTAVEIAGNVTGLAGMVVIDATNRFGRTGSSVAEEIAAAAPGAYIIKAFNTLGTNIYAHPDFDGTAATMFIAGNSDGAKATVTQMCEALGFHVVDAGGLAYAYHLEKLAEMWVHLADRRGFGREIAFRLMQRT